MTDVTDINIHRATDMALGAVDVARDCDHLGLDVASINVTTYSGIAVQLADEDQVDTFAEFYGLDPDDPGDGVGGNYTRGTDQLRAYCGRTTRTARCGCGKPCNHKATT